MSPENAHRCVTLTNQFAKLPRGHHLSEDKLQVKTMLLHAMEHVAGYTVAHDVSARDWQLKRNGGQWLLGKTADGYAPLGPAIVTRDELPDVRNLGSALIAARTLD